MDNKQENLDNFVQKLLKLQAEKENEEALSDEDLKFIAEGMGIDVGDLEQARKDYATRAAGHLQYQNWQDAIKEYKELLILSPQDANAHYGLALAYAGLWKEKYNNTDKDKAIKYAEKTLILDPKHQQALKLLSQLRKRKQTFTSNNNVNTITSQAGKKAKNAIVLAAVIMFVAIGAITFIIQSAVTSTVKSVQNGINSSYSKPSNTTIYNSITGIDSKGAVYWSMEYEQYHTNDGLVRDFFARIINPKNGQEMKKIYFAKEESITNYKWQQAEFINGKFYNFDRNAQTFEARDIYTGSIVENPEILSNKYPQLKQGIGEVKEENIWYKLTLKNGDVFWYSPYLELLHNEEEHKSWISNGKNISTYTSYEWYFEEQGAKRRYYLFTKEKRQRNYNKYKQRPRPIDLSSNSRYNNSRYFKSRYGTQISKEPSDWFLKSEVLHSDGEICIILHKKEIGENTPNILTAIDKNGKILWQSKKLNSILLENLKPNNLPSLKTNQYKNTLVLDFPYLKVEGNDRSYRFMTAINLKSGKMLWEYSPNYEANP